MKKEFMFAAAVLVPCVSLFADQPIDIGNRRELMIDHHLIDEFSGGARLQLNKPVRQEIALVTDAPWEGNACHYRSVFQDGDRYRMYYGGYQYDVGPGRLTYPHRACLCYAESHDGVRWVKPELGLVEFDGSVKNNIVFSAATLKEVAADPGHVAVFKDTNPHCPPDARYKAVVRSDSVPGLLAFRSADGFVFELMQREPVITKGAFDSQNLAFWDGVRGEYRAYFRGLREGIRSIFTATSADFLHWTRPQRVEFPGAPQEHIYTNQVIPYERAPHIFTGFPMRYTDRGHVDSTDKLPHPELRQLRASNHPRYGSAVTDGLFMTSRDGRHFHRWGEALIRPGAARTNAWVYGDNSAAWGIVTTKSAVDKAPDELSMYVTEGYWTGSSLNVRRYSIRVDGFVSVNAPLSGGALLTRPILFKGSRLTINYSTSAAGGIWFEILDVDGRPFEGFGQDECYEIFGDEIERTVTWKRGQDVSCLSGKAVRLRVVLRDADLYSFRFGGTEAGNE
ncbi:MAG: hypothetical protein MK110_07950 [Fuerstiella sp.]|nr:hypothetical protein [Fuerstiella sp.]